MFGKSNTKGVSLAHENVSSANPIINNNISIQQDISDEKSIQVIEKQSVEDNNISNNQESIPQSDPSLIQSENSFLKAILKIYIGQKLYFNGKYIVCTLQELIELLQLITNGEIDIEVEPFDVACCGNSSTYSKVSVRYYIRVTC